MAIKAKALLLCGLYLFFTGCSTTREYAYIGSDVASYRDKRISSVTLKNGETINYIEPGATYYEEHVGGKQIPKIIGFTSESEQRNVDISRVLEVVTTAKKGDMISTFVLCSGLAVVLIILAGLLVTTSTPSSFTE